MLIRLSARIEEAAKAAESPSSEDEIYYPTSENGTFAADLNELLTRKSMSDEDALDRRKQIAQVFRKSTSLEVPSEVQSKAPSEVQAALERQATLFKELGLDDQEPQSKVQTNQRPPVSNNPYAPLLDQDLSDDEEAPPAAAPSRPVMHTMMPAGNSPFWIRYGNKLRVNGTVEEFCIIE